MAKTKISEFSSTPGSNTDIDGINIAEGCAPSGINDAIRELMAQLKDFQTGAAGDSFNGPVGTTTAAAGAFTTLSASGTTTLSGLTASTALALDASKNVVSVTNTGTGNNVLATSPTLVTPALGTPSSATLTNATGLPISTGVSGLGTGIATALAVNVGTAGAPVVNGGALGTPSSGTVTNLTGTASININGTVGATTANTGAFTTLSASSDVTLSGGTANGVAYLNGSKVVTTGTALTFNGSILTNTSGAIRASGPSVPATGAGLELLYGASGTGISTVLSYDRGATAYKPLWIDGSYQAYFISGSEQMRLTSTGIGIGTSSPSVKLEVNRGSAGTVARFGGGGTSGILFSESSFFAVAESSGANGINIYGAANYLAFNTNSAERMRLSADGHLGLGVTPSAWYSTRKALQVGVGAALEGNASNYAFMNLGANYYVNASGNNTYIGSNYATLYSQSSGQHKWFTAASGTAGNAISFSQVMTLDASGNLGVGTTVPGSFGKLSVVGTIAPVSPDATIQGIYSAANTGEIRLGGFKSGGGTFLVLTTGSDVERARIDSSGNLLVGTTTAASLVDSSSPAGGGYFGVAKTNDCPVLLKRSGTDGAIILFAKGGVGNVGSISVTTTATAYNTSSDYRLKNTIAPMTGALAKVAALKPVTYKWNADGSDGEGFIAHELAEVVPQCVTGEKDAVDAEGKPVYQGIDTSFLVATLTAAIQELKAEFDAYKASHP